MMTNEDKILLERSRPKLMKSIDLQASALFAELRARGVITPQNQEVIETAAGNCNQVGRLLDILLRGDENCMDMFIYALVESGHAALARKYLREPRQKDIIST